MINRTHAEHTAVAVVIQLALWPLLGLLAGGVVAIALLLGREIAQHEYKLALDRDWQYGQRKPVAWHEGVTRGWSVDSVLDVVVPGLACLVTYLAFLVWLA